MKNIVILGSTGSIGAQTLDVIRANDDMNVVAIAAGSNIDLLKKQIDEFLPSKVCVYNKDKALELKKLCSSGKPQILSGMEGMIEISTMEEADIVVASVVGMIGIKPVIEAIKAGKNIAFANKETLVTAGHIIMPLVKEKNINFMPVDSEHAAIFQCMNGESKSGIKKILLTASGGPFRGKKRKDLINITPEEALKHPNWSMGHKITIDSSTMVNKGLEVIEAKWLFDISVDDIQVVLQPQSVIHSMVEFCDGAVLAQLGTPDMKLPIQYALTYPERRYLHGDRLDFSTMSGLYFENPDTDTFKGLSLAYEAGREGGSLPTVFNAANEISVSLFLENKIGFLDIADNIEKCMKVHKNIAEPTLDDILEVEKETHDMVKSFCNIR